MSRVFGLSSKRRTVSRRPFARTLLGQFRQLSLESRDVPSSSISILSTSLTEGDSGTANMTFNVVRSGDPNPAIAVSYTTSNGTGIAGTDYFATSGTLNIPSGAVVSTISVPVIGNLILQNNRTFNLKLTGVTSPPSGVTIVNDTGIGTIQDNDAPYIISMSSTQAQAQISQSFNLPTVTVRNTNGNPVSNAQVQFIIGSSGGGATATFPGGSTVATVTTPSGGVATPPTITANGTTGTYPVTVATTDYFGTYINATNIDVSNVNTVPTETTLTATPPNPVVYGSAVNFTATVVSTVPGGPTPTGFVTFTEGSTVLGTASLVSGAANFSFSTFDVGVHSIKADYTSIDGFTSSSSAPVEVDVNPKPLVGSFTAANKTYDGTTSGTIMSRSLTGVLPGDSVTMIGGSATFANANVGNTIFVDGTGFSLTGTDAANYTIGSVNPTSANISALAINGSFIAANKVYDGTTSATITSRNLSGVIPGDTVSMSGGTATFASPNVGNNIVVNGVGFGLTGASSGNYTLNPVPSTTANIVAPSYYAAAAGPNGGSQVKIYDSATGNEIQSFNAYDSSFKGGVSIAVGDVTGDGIPDIVTGALAGGGPHVKVFSGPDFTLSSSFYPYDTSFSGGVNVAVGNFDSDSAMEIVTGAGPGGGPHVRTFNVNSDGSVTQLSGPLGSFFAYNPIFSGGVNVAAGNVNGSGLDELVTGAGPGGGPHVRAFTTTGSLALDFFAYDTSFTGGVFVSAGMLDSSGEATIVTGAGAGGAPHVRLFRDEGGLAALQGEFMAYGISFLGGVHVAVADYKGGSLNDIYTAPGTGGGPVVRVFEPAKLSLVTEFNAFDPTFQGGVYVGGSLS